MRPSIRPRSLPTLIHELDEVFSKWIRRRDSVDGRVICFTCGKKMTFSESQCGHFIDRDQTPTRYDEMNCHAVCEFCNCMDDNHYERYAAAMVNKYGIMAVRDLKQKARGLQKFMRHELEELIEYYKSENRQKSKV